MKSAASLALGLALAVLALTGCSSVPLRGVSTAVVGIKPADPAQIGQELTVTVQYINENVFPYGISGSRHKLSLNGRYVGAGEGKPIGIPPQQVATQDISVKLDHPEAVRQLLATGDGRAAYELDTVLRQTIDEEKSESKIRSTGVVDLTAGK